MGTIVVVLLVALVLAAAVIVYAAFPYRGEETPVHPGVGNAMKRGVESLHTIDPRETRPDADPEVNRVPSHR